MTTPRDTLKRRYGPGFWEDMEGGFHISIPEWLAACDLPDTPENRALASKLADVLLREQCPKARIIYREKPDGPLT